MNKTTVFLIAAFVLSVGAGMSLGVYLTRTKHEDHRSWLMSQLNLTEEQGQQMQKIWSDTVGALSRQQAETRNALSQKRDQDIQALLSPDQRDQYEKIRKEYSQKMDELAQERKRVFDSAVAKTKLILTPKQIAKYEELMKKRMPGPDGGPMGGRHHMGMDGGPHFGGPRPGPGSEPGPIPGGPAPEPQPTSQPTSTPAA